MKKARVVGDRVLRFGAIHHEMPRSLDIFKKRAALEAYNFFRNESDVAEWRAQIQALGVPPDMTNVNEIENIITKALGAPANAAEVSDLDASRVWALVGFASIDADMRGLQEVAKMWPFENSDNTLGIDLPAAILDRAAMLGRIIEWWRWRSGGHDAAAVSGARTQRQRSDGGKQRRRKDHDEIISAMSWRIEAGKTQRQAGNAAHDVDGLGVNGAANVQIWKRHMRALKKQGQS